MANDYPFEELGKRAFEQLTVALAMEVMGSGVEAFGAGPDGGREATFDGKVNWSATSGFGDESWNGYVVIQAKHKEFDEEPAKNFSWLRDQVVDELDRWMSSTNRVRFPNYVVFVTNARLSSVAGRGGIDSINTYLANRINQAVTGRDGRSTSLRDLGLRAAKVWHRDQLNALLSVHHGIRLNFKGMLTVGDVLGRLGELGGLLEPDKFQPVLSSHASSSLSAEQWVNFREAGGTTRQSIEKVFIDLKFSDEQGRSGTVLNEVIASADSVLKPSVNPDARHMVITGHPGSGKSTISKFLTQMYRTVFVSEETNLTGTAKSIVESTSVALSRIGITSPKNHRWPIKIDLAEYADALGPSGDKTLLRWMSEKINERCGIDILPNALARWIQHWPCLVILDGLDEVTAPEVRPRVLDEIKLFVEEADRDDADLLVIVTTRPTGYTERILPSRFMQFDLDYLDAQTAIRYGGHITALRLEDDPDRRRQVTQRFERHSKEPATLRLMKTPLQVLIMTLILEKFGSLPADRYQLFWRYFETIYEREASKNTVLSRLFTDQRPAIVKLHEAVGVALQIQSETSTDARAILSSDALQRLAFERLIEVGYENNRQTEHVVDQIIQAATERLVLLVPAENGGFSFEIRSLQELMAARGLSDATDEDLARRLRITARSPHWRNTWLFVAGRVFAEFPDHRKDLLAEVVETVDADSEWPGWVCAIAPELAAQLIEDGLALSTPKWQKRFLDVALRVLSGPVLQDERALAAGLTAAANDTQQKLYIRNAIKQAFASTPLARATAVALADHASLGDIPGISDARRSLTPFAPDSTFDLNERLRPVVEELDLAPEERAQFAAIIAELTSASLVGATDGTIAGLRNMESGPLPLTMDGLDSPDIASALDLAFGSLPPEQWVVRARLSRLIWPRLSREPVEDFMAELSDVRLHSR